MYVTRTLKHWSSICFYVYKELALIADEVGGYIGLFGGYSVYQITDMFDMFF